MAVLLLFLGAKILGDGISGFGTTSPPPRVTPDG
jgi:hypothetical protein